MNKEDTKQAAIKTLKENCCAMCAYTSYDMDSCDIRSCDNKDAIKVLEQESCEDAIKYFNTIYELSQTLGVSYSFIKDEIKEIEKTLKTLPQEPCTDAISRQAVLDLAKFDGRKNLGSIIHAFDVEQLPPVTPEPNRCNQCKYYEGVHNVQGHAPCSFLKCGGVLWDWYCSNYEPYKGDEENGIN